MLAFIYVLIYVYRYHKNAIPYKRCTHVCLHILVLIYQYVRHQNFHQKDLSTTV